MTRDQITKLAARVCDLSTPIYAFTLDELEDFTCAVAKTEREACARICDCLAEGEPDNDSAAIAASVIRARGDA